MHNAVAAPRLNSSGIRARANGHWPSILSSLGIQVPSSPKLHDRCPTCGGKDRFRFDDLDGNGSWYCNQCAPTAGDGFALVQNVRGCGFTDALQLVADALGCQPSYGDKPRKISTTYDYTDANGVLIFQVVRYIPKDFRQRRPDGHGGWAPNLNGVETVLYKLPKVLKSQHVLIVEGEKDVETAFHLGLPDDWAATCNPMGAGKWRDSYSDALLGRHGELASVVIESYLATLPTSGKKPTTIADEKYYGQWWKDRVAGKALHAVTPSILDNAMTDLAAKHYTPQTIVHYLKFLRHVFRWAIGRGVIEKSPFANVKLPTVRAGETRFLSIEEEARLCQAIGQPYDAWVRLAILTGLRKSEQFGLRWADIDLERGLMTLPHTKSWAVQYIHLVEEAKQILKSLIPGNTSVWVFPSENPDTHLDPDNFYGRVYMTALEKAKLEGVTWHTLRHTFASRLAMNGQAPSTIAALLRHSGTDLVAQYAHLSPSHLQGALEGVSGFGKVKPEPVQIVPEPRQKGEISIPTVSGTGTEEKEQEGESVQVVESIGRGERI